MHYRFSDDNGARATPRRARALPLCLWRRRTAVEGQINKSAAALSGCYGSLFLVIYQLLLASTLIIRFIGQYWRLLSDSVFMENSVIHNELPTVLSVWKSLHHVTRVILKLIDNPYPDKLIFLLEIKKKHIYYLIWNIYLEIHDKHENIEV